MRDDKWEQLIMNKVYILFESYCRDPFNVVGVYSTMEKAEKEKDRIESACDFSNCIIIKDEVL